MKQDLDGYKPYNYDLVRAILNVWPQIEAVKERGALVVIPTPCSPKLEDRLGADELGYLCPRPSGRRNLPYRIDDVMAICLDVERALTHALDFKSQARLMLYFKYGYKYGEIAEMEGTVETNVRSAIRRSIEVMTDFLEGNPWL